MHAAVVSAFDSAPAFRQHEIPEPTSPHEMRVRVIAAGLHPRVRSQANGSHYTSTAELPLVPGIDGVGRGQDGLLRYFILEDTTMGSMAQQTVIDVRRSVVLPESTDPVAVAAAMNPAMASWIALRRRVAFDPGQNVLVLGATGNAGRMAVQVAKMLGAEQIVAAARNTDLLAALPTTGATATVVIGDGSAESAERLGVAASETDVVLDFVWGPATASAMSAVVTARKDRSRQLTWIEIGSVSSPAAEIPSAALRAARLQIVGSGQGSVGTGEIIAELPALAKAITDGAFDIDAEAVPLGDVERAWTESLESRRRIVFTP